MDPHSTRSQFNQRAPKAGPKAHKYMEMPKPALEPFPKRPASASRKPSPSPVGLINRPIATNSRVKQDEKYRKDMHLAFVNNALLQKANGSSEPFDELVSQFSAKDAPQPAQLRLWISALSHVVSRLERSHATLVQAVVGIPWTTMDDATVKAFTIFIGMLLSARPEYLSLVLGKITHGFTYQAGLQALEINTPEGSSSPLTRRLIYDRLHFLLRHLLSLIPTLPATLQPLIVRNFPHKRQNQVMQSTYIRNLLRISTYCPELTDKIMSTIVDRAIQIDVEIQVELEELEENQTEVDQDVFEFDPFDAVLGQEHESDSSDDDDDGNMSDFSSDDDEAEVSSELSQIQEMVKKLDSILVLIFEHFQRAQEPLPLDLTGDDLSPGLPDLPPLPPLTPLSPWLPPVLPVADFSIPTETPSTPKPTRPSSSLNAQFHTLLAIFDRLILPTFKSRYTQFLVFFYTSLSPDFADIFLGLLVDRALFQPTTPAVTRAAAAAYIGSFVSRAAFIDREGARRVVGVLCDFLRAHLDGVEDALLTGAPMWRVSASSSQSGVFYAVAQAMFLIFCFRWRDLLEDDEEIDVDDLAGKAGKKWMPVLGVIPRMIQSVLNPLKVCSSSVVAQFARVAQATDFTYCYTILESNRRLEFSAVSDSGITAELNAFFPFDPYKLAKSSAFIQGIYREWSSVAIDDDDEDEDDEDADVDTELPAASSYPGLSIPKSRGAFDDGLGLGESLGKMSISPAHALL
ncbi:RNA polymerase I-specific transcription initiation factor RRN3 [Roridomyces roridus]|uniref:RNA polymerase I-specific transcription initiation factor RRN3 n=1 Tax=Roridomyces roridus TaxID=1738132 RepID=A0AAD7FVD3_9AGAR|nr:RNA polymerase I-specific transcription initiation factor RRN3 [Roridomyces roridus]